MTTTTFQEALDHRDAMLDVFVEITQDCVLLGLRPGHVSVRQYSAGSLSADVQFIGQDKAAVDALAVACGGLDEAFVGEHNYGRKGRLDLGAHRVEITVYTGRPAGLTSAPRAVQS